MFKIARLLLQAITTLSCAKVIGTNAAGRGDAVGIDEGNAVGLPVVGVLVIWEVGNNVGDKVVGVLLIFEGFSVGG